MENRPTSLHECLGQNEKCQWRFGQAKELSRFLYDLQGNRMLMPFYTDHGPRHCQRVEEIVDQIIFGPPEARHALDDRAFVPTPEEAAYLRSAIYLHDIGTIYGIFPYEVTPPNDWERYRDKHELRSAEYIREHWQLNCEHWAPHEKIQLGHICIFHRQRHSLESMSPAQGMGQDGKPIRFRELAALLRIGDACHVDDTRAPIELRNLFFSVGMPARSLEHWSIPARIHRLHFDNATKRIQPHCYIPREKTYGLAKVDFQLAIHRLVQGIQRELDSVKPYLATYSNTGYEAVEPVVARPAAMGEPEQYLKGMWPCMLSGVSSASEVASMLAATLLANIHGTDELPEHEISEVLGEAERLHPYNFLVRRLARRVRQNIETTTPPVEVRRYLTAYLAQRVTACDRTAEAARKCIDRDDVLVIYGYSHTVMTLLTRKLGPHNGKVLVVMCHRNDPGLTIERENERVMDELDTAPLSYRVVEMASLREIFAHFHKRGTRAKVLIGARGMFGDGDILSTAGNAMIAAAARASGIDVLVLTEPDKALSDPDTQAEMERLLAEQVGELIFGINGVAQIAAPIDRLTPDMYDTLVSAGEAATPEADEVA